MRPDVRLEVRLLDVSRADAPAQTLAEVTIPDAGLPPYRFELPYAADRLQTGHRYSVQAKLLRLLQERCFERVGGNRSIAVNIRIVAATNRDLAEMVAAGTFREDLFYRINTIQIEIPPLRNRREDIALFVDYFLKKYTDLYGRPGLILHPQALEKLANYDWPGNIRELQHTIEKAVILAEKNVIRASDLFIRPGKALSFSEVPNLEEVERQAILAAITQNEGNLTAAAEQLGVSRQTLYNKM